jgi:hypothetical protein
MMLLIAFGVHHRQPAISRHAAGSCELGHMVPQAGGKRVGRCRDQTTVSWW